MGARERDGESRGHKGRCGKQKPRKVKSEYVCMVKEEECVVGKRQEQKEKPKEKKSSVRHKNK